VRGMGDGGDMDVLLASTADSEFRTLISDPGGCGRTGFAQCDECMEVCEGAVGCRWIVSHESCGLMGSEPPPWRALFGVMVRLDAVACWATSE
jgi:hypothetical protein